MTAAESGLSIDFCLLGEQEMDLSFYKVLSYMTGGFIYYYPTLKDCTLPQDMFVLFKVEFNKQKNKKKKRWEGQII